MVCRERERERERERDEVRGSEREDQKRGGMKEERGESDSWDNEELTVERRE